MAGILTQEQMDVLELWINRGSKTFTLLYKITRDGCDATTFHQTCDKKGPTVIVLYGPDGTVYGGYTAVCWSSGNQWFKDDTAFLYRLQYTGGVSKRIKFPVKPGGKNAVHCGPMYGPIFGQGNGLDTFQGTIPNTGGQFNLNGNVNGLGDCYDALGMSSNDLNGGSMVVTELEVYGVADGVIPKPVLGTAKASGQMLETPWRRSPSWDESKMAKQQYDSDEILSQALDYIEEQEESAIFVTQNTYSQLLESLMEAAVTYKPVSDECMVVKESRILFLGPVGSGKTSYFNTIQSIFKDRITRKGCSGSAQHSITTTYRQYQVRCQSGAPLNVRLCDTRGLEETYGLDPLELNYLLDGNVPDWYQFNPDGPITTESREFVKNPGPGDKIHCVVFVIDASTLEVLPDKTVESMKRAQATMYRKGIPQTVLLTKVDKICKEVGEDLSKTYRSKAVKDMVDKVEQIFGVSPGNVFPVKNYHTEIDLERDLNILALLALRQMLYSADDYLENCLDRIQSDKARTMKD